MRKLLIFLSVFLFIALCQARPTTNVHVPKNIQPLDCTFGFKKVNGTKRCKTMTEFFQHPRNETNCTKLQKLKCYNYKNSTACLCIKKPILPPHPSILICGPNLVWRCKGKNNCKCSILDPARLTSRFSMNCKAGEKYICPARGRCRCKKIEREPTVEPIIEPYLPTFPEPM